VIRILQVIDFLGCVSERCGRVGAVLHDLGGGLRVEYVDSEWEWASERASKWEVEC
jgi:hypothetical protein